MDIPKIFPENFNISRIYFEKQLSYSDDKSVIHILFDQTLLGWCCFVTAIEVTSSIDSYTL